MKKSLLILFLFVIVGFGCNSYKELLNSEKTYSQWIYPGEDGKLVYKTTPLGDKIMDFSHAGYMGGGVAFPNVTVKKTVKPSGGNDDTDAIQAAIDEVAAMPIVGGFRGAVLLEPGVYTCARAITISADGIVLRGSGSGANKNPKKSTIKMIGDRHTAIVIGLPRNRGAENNQQSEPTFKTIITDKYVPSGAISFTVDDASGFAKGDIISIQRPITEDWVKFMNMDKMTRDGRPQTWMRVGSNTTTERTIVSISGNTITLDIPLSDSFDSKFLNPQGTTVAKIIPATMVEQAGIEYLHIQAPPMEMSYQQAPYTAIRINGRDCWARDVIIEETMNSVGVGGKRITLERIAVYRTVPNLGASKPAEFAPNAGQVLLDRCTGNGDNIWYIATGAGFAGPIVFLNCTFLGNGRVEGHQRWTTGMLADNCNIPNGGIDFRDRGSMGSGHGWSNGWSVAWNCVTKNYIIQQPPGAYNWAIGCVGENIPTPRPFNTAPFLPSGVFDSPGKHVEPHSIYLAQLAERLGPQALINIGYSPEGHALIEPEPFEDFTKNVRPQQNDVDKILGFDIALHRLANPSNVRNGERQFGGERVFDGNPNTYWATDDSVTKATLELDLEDPQEINAVELQEAPGFTNRVLKYKVEGMVDSDWKLLSKGTTIGERILDRFPKVVAWKVKLTLEAKQYPAIRKFGLYLDKISPPDSFKSAE